LRNLGEAVPSDEAEFGGADQITDVLHNEQIELFEIKLFERAAQPFGRIPYRPTWINTNWCAFYYQFFLSPAIKN